jgi:hypothetical protein
MSGPRSVGEVLAAMGRPWITAGEAEALQLGAAVLAEVAEALGRSGRAVLAAESARSAAALDGLRDRAVVAAEGGSEGPEVQP